MCRNGRELRLALFRPCLSVTFLLILVNLSQVTLWKWSHAVGDARGACSGVLLVAAVDGMSQSVG